MTDMINSNQCQFLWFCMTWHRFDLHLSFIWIHAASQNICKINFREDFVEYMKKKKTEHEEEQVCSVFQIVSKLVHMNSQLFILQFIACRHSNLEPELIIRFPSRNFGALSL